jgi:hypothetical protein
LSHVHLRAAECDANSACSLVHPSVERNRRSSGQALQRAGRHCERRAGAEAGGQAPKPTRRLQRALASRARSGRTPPDIRMQERGDQRESGAPAAYPTLHKTMRFVLVNVALAAVLFGVALASPAPFAGPVNVMLDGRAIACFICPADICCDN